METDERKSSPPSHEEAGNPAFAPSNSTAGNAVRMRPGGIVIGIFLGVLIGALCGIAAGPVGSLAGAVVGAGVGGFLGATGFSSAGQRPSK